MKPVTKMGLALLLAVATLLAVSATPRKLEASGPYTYHAKSGYYVGADGYYYQRFRYRYRSFCGGYSYYGPWRYRRVNYQPQYPAQPKYVTSDTENWRSALLEIAKQRDVYEGRLRQSALNHAEFLEAVRALGLEGNFQWQAYGAAPQLASNPYAYASAQAQAQASGYLQQPTPQGATVYGYSSVADVYGDVDLGALYQQAIRLGEQGQAFGAKAASDAASLVAQEGENRARVSTILAEGQVAVEKLRAVRPEPQGTIKTQQFRVEIGPNGQPSIQPATPQASASAAVDAGVAEAYRLAQELSDAKCVRCHGGAETHANLDLSDLSKLTQDQTDAVLRSIIDPNPETRMPKDAPPLTQEERRIFYRAAGRAD